MTRMIDVAMQQSATACRTFELGGNSPKASVSSTAIWKPNSACAPGSSTRASVSICSTRTSIGVSCSAMLFAPLRGLRIAHAAPYQSTSASVVASAPMVTPAIGPERAGGERPEAVGDDDREIGAEAERQRQQRQGGEPIGLRDDAAARAAVLDDAMLHGRSDQQPDADGYRRERAGVKDPPHLAELAEA